MALRHDLRRGVTFMLLACALFTFMSMVVKGLSGRVPFQEQMFFRSAFALPVVAAIVLRRSGMAGGFGVVLRTKRLRGHLLRAGTGVCATACSFYALTVLPLALVALLIYWNIALIAQRDVVGQAEHKRGVMRADILGDEVRALGHGQVVHLLLAKRLDRHDRVPEDLRAGDLLELWVFQHRRVALQPRARDAAPGVRVVAGVLARIG